MQKAKLFMCALLITSFLGIGVNAEVVVNELYYDHLGTDTDYEFIELYNNGVADVDLTGWQIQWGGTDFTYGTYDFPFGTTIFAGDYLLVGGNQVATYFGVSPDLIYAFTFQNGGTATDAVRIIDDALIYHDTCLYDWPNLNNLEGDASNPADSLECTIDVIAGSSLSRITVGVDNNLATDWEELIVPAPTNSQTTLTISNIADIRVNDLTGSPLYLDSLVTITGIITSATELGGSGPAYMYDNTGAVAVYDGTVSTSGVAIGDSVIVTGWVGFYNGLTEIVDEPLSGTPEVAFQIISSGNDVTPIISVPTDLNEANEAYLLKIESATFVEAGLFSTGTYNAYVGTDTFVVYIDYDSGLSGEAIPVDAIDIIGVVGQYDSSSPYEDGYQLIPRMVSDLVGGGGLVGPVIDDSYPNPYLPDDMEDVVLTSLIYDDVSVASAYGYYDAGAGWVQVELFDDGLHGDGAAGDSVYGNTIPGQAAGTWVNYYVEATDNEANTSYDPANAPTGYYEYEHHDYSVITPLADIRATDTSGVTLMLDALVTVEGYVNVADQYGYSGPAYIQSELDGGYGLAVYDGVVASGIIAIGDYIRVTGWIIQYNGLVELVDAPYNSSYNPVIEVLSSGNTLIPADVEDLDNIMEDYEGVLVEARGVRFVDTGLFSGSTNYVVTSGNDSAEFRVDSDTNIEGEPIPENQVTVVGVLGQYDSSSPYFSGYQILPRFIDDVYTPEQYIEIAAVTPPVQIPAGGGSFDYNIDVYNTSASSASFAVSMYIELPTGNYYYFTPAPIQLTVPAGWTGNRLKTRNIPGVAPEGLYSYRLTVEDPVTAEIWTSDAIAIEKLAVSDGGEIVQGWEERALTDWTFGPIEGALEAVVQAIPTEFSLEQAYPNPFNPTANINFALPVASSVKLQVYNLHGQLVGTLVDGYRDAGFHEVTFDAADMASGMYIYRVQAGENVATGKMMLVK
ncbi:lamin tail domain-containing protein [bacterium]|nr:lamin tail domain-containing protein [bacterium]